MPVTHHCCTLEYVCGAVALARYRRPSLGIFSLDWAAHYRAAFFSGQATVCSVDDQDIAQFLLREGWAELPIDVTDQAYALLGLFVRSLSIRRSAASTRSRARSRSAIVYGGAVAVGRSPCGMLWIKTAIDAFLMAGHAGRLVRCGQGLASRDRMNDFFLLPWSGRLDGSMKLWFLRRRCVLCRLRRL